MWPKFGQFGLELYQMLPSTGEWNALPSEMSHRTGCHPLSRSYFSGFLKETQFNQIYCTLFSFYCFCANGLMVNTLFVTRSNYGCPVYCILDKFSKFRTQIRSSNSQATSNSFDMHSFDLVRLIRVQSSNILFIGWKKTFECQTLRANLTKDFLSDGNHSNGLHRMELHSMDREVL